MDSAQDSHPLLRKAWMTASADRLTSSSVVTQELKLIRNAGLLFHMVLPHQHTPPSCIIRIALLVIPASAQDTMT